MTKYVLGLDIGVTSVGYGVIDLDNNEFVAPHTTALFILSFVTI